MPELNSVRIPIRRNAGANSIVKGGTPPCIDLVKSFPRLVHAWEDPAFKGSQDPWHYVILCKYGHICPAGGDKLWVCTNHNKGSSIAKKLSALPELSVVAEAEDGINAEFDIKDWEKVFKFMKARKRRQVDPNRAKVLCQKSSK